MSRVARLDTQGLVDEVHMGIVLQGRGQDEVGREGKVSIQLQITV